MDGIGALGQSVLKGMAQALSSHRWTFHNVFLSSIFLVDLFYFLQTVKCIVVLYVFVWVNEIYVGTIADAK
jgi:hypothetical protein